MHMLANMLGSNALALQEKVINSEGPCYVRLIGRKSGLIDWLLTLLGINTRTMLEIYEDRIEYSYGSLSGRVLEVIPLSQVSNLVCGYFKPVVLLFLAVISLPLVFFTFGLSLILTALLVFFYFFQKSTLISIIPASSSAASVAFKRSLIENQNITEEEAAQIIKLVAGLVEKANQR